MSFNLVYSYTKKNLAVKNLILFRLVFIALYIFFPRLMERTVIYTKVMFIEISVWWFRMLMTKNVKEHVIQYFDEFIYFFFFFNLFNSSDTYSYI